MKKVVRVQTMDGVLHEDLRRARHYADERYGNALTQLAGKAVSVEKYTKMVEFIDAHLVDFVFLKALKDDLTLEDERAEDDCG